MTALELFLAEDEAAEMKRITTYAPPSPTGRRHSGSPRSRRAGRCQSFLPHAVIYFTPDWIGPSGNAVQVALAKGDPHIYVQQGAHQGGYFDEIAIDPFNLQPGDDAILVKRLREELTRR